MYDWLTVNKLSLNTKKTKYMAFHNHQKKLENCSTCSFLTYEPSKIIINNIPIEKVKTHLFLGIKIHENISWDDHINSIATKISKTIGILRCIKSYMSVHILKTIYNSLVLPYLQYGILIWGFTCQRLETLQKKCIRLISKAYPYEHTEKLFKSLNILKIMDIFKYKCLILFYKFKHNSLPVYLSNLFSYFTPNNIYPIRSHESRIMQEPYCKLRSTENCIRFLLPKTINNLNEDELLLCDANNINLFKTKLKKYMIANYSDLACDIENCYPCMRILFYPNYLSILMQHINIFAYLYRFTP